MRYVQFGLVKHANCLDTTPWLLIINGELVHKKGGVILFAIYHQYDTDLLLEDDPRELLPKSKSSKKLSWLEDRMVLVSSLSGVTCSITFMSLVAE